MKPGKCAPEFDYLRNNTDLGLSDNISWSRRCIKPIAGPSDRAAVQNITGPLISHPTKVNLQTCAHDELPPCEELSLTVSGPYPKKQYEHIIFGVASEYKRLMDSIPSTAHWLAGTGATLIGVVVDAKGDDGKAKLKNLEDAYHEANVKATFISPVMTKYLPPQGSNPEENQDKDVPTEHHHFMLIRDLLGYSTSQTTWLGILDDDTFFPSLYPVDEELNKYDHNQPQWLGALSEDWGHIKIWGLMAFGGAGVFISVPLAHELDPHLEDCIVEALSQTGDGILRDCVYFKTQTKLTAIPRFFQHDFIRDASGFYESGINPLSLHHWKSWYQEPIPAQAAIAAVCGECYLQRWRFADDTLFANGYSISVYADGLKDLDLTKYEGTWDSPAHELNGHEYDYSFGPLRPRLGADKKKSYKLKAAEKTAAGGLRQVYVFKGDREQILDEVVELIWEPTKGAHPDEWDDR